MEVSQTFKQGKILMHSNGGEKMKVKKAKRVKGRKKGRRKDNKMNISGRR